MNVCPQGVRMLLISIFISLAITEAYRIGGENSKPPRKQWAFLVASSNGWFNYRHQADVCHAYHVMRSNGIHAENIITMMYDDIANNTRNPHKGAIFNQPDGPNVYEGVVKDYTGSDVNVKNFLNILKGDKEAMKGIGSGRVIESGPEDHIFVNIVDHGSTGVLCFPNEEYMYANQLSNELRNMKRDRRFAKMVVYVEACEGGSMFDNILEDQLDVYVTTASAPDESSYAYYCDDLDTCLGDMYSAAWMENMDLLRESWSDRYVTLFKQYKHVRTVVNKSHVMLYGDFRLGFDRLSDYMGDTGVRQSKLFPLGKKLSLVKHKKVSTSVKSRDVPLYVYTRQLSKYNDEGKQKEAAEMLQKLKKGREFVDYTIDQILANLAGDDYKLYNDLTYSRQPLNHEIFPCYKNVIDEFNTHCFNTHQNPYLLNHFYKLANMCLLNISKDQVINAFNEVCVEHHRKMQDIY